MNYFLAFTFFACTAMGFAQDCDHVLTGVVRDRHTNETVPFARLSVIDQSQHVQADSLGRFRFEHLCSGPVVLRCIPHFGCEPAYVTVSLPFSGELELSVETHLTELDYALVEAYRFRRESQAVMKLDTRDLSVIRGSTLGEQLGRLPGVTTLNTGSSIVKPVINGMHSNRLVVVNDGIRQEGQQWGSEHAPEIDPNLAGNLEVIQGAQGLQYGPDAIGGVILVSPDALRYGKPVNGWIKTTASSNGRGGMVSGLIAGSLTSGGKLAYRLHGTGRISGTQHTPDYYVKNTALNEYSFSAGAGYKATRFEADAFYSLFTTNIGIFTGSHIGNLSDLNAAFTAEQPKDTGVFTYAIGNPKQFVQHQLARLTASYDWNSRVRSTAIFGYQYNLRREYDLHKAYNDSIAALDLPSFELNLWTTSLETKTVITHSEHFTSTFGASGFKQGNAYAGRFFIPNFHKWQGGAYYTGQYENALWLFDFGARYDISKLKAYLYVDDSLTSPETTFHNMSYSAGASRMFGHHWIAKLHLGTAWRPPSINELYSDGLHHGAAAIEIGDETLHKEIVYHAQLGAQYKSRLAKLDISAFYNYFDGYINLQPSLPPQLTIVGAFPVFRYRQSDVSLSGVNGQLEIPLRKWLNYTLTGSLIYAVHTGPHTPVYGLPSNRLTNRLRAGETFKKAPAWSWFAEIEGQQVFEQKRVPADADYVAPPEGYFLLNGAIGLLKKTATDEAIQVVLSVSNLTNSSYRDYMNRFRYFTDETGRNWTVKVFIPFSIKQIKNK
jgi:iron complex outermembrane receptor protein